MLRPIDMHLLCKIITHEELNKSTCVEISNYIGVVSSTVNNSLHRLHDSGLIVIDFENLRKNKNIKYRIVFNSCIHLLAFGVNYVFYDYQELIDDAKIALEILRCK